MAALARSPGAALRRALAAAAPALQVRRAGQAGAARTRQGNITDDSTDAGESIDGSVANVNLNIDM